MGDESQVMRKTSVFHPTWRQDKLGEQPNTNGNAKVHHGTDTKTYNRGQGLVDSEKG